MLKLLTYEMKETWKYYLLVLLIFFVMLIRVPVSYSPNAHLISISFTPMVMMYSLYCVVALFLVAGFLFVKNMFKKGASFTRSLPISTNQMLMVHLLVTFVWTIVSLLFVVVAVFVQFAMSSSNSDMSIVLEAMRELVDLCVSQITTYPLPLLFVGLKVFGTLLEILLCLYFSLALAHTSWIRSYRTLIGSLIFLILMLILGEQMLKDMTQPMFIPYSMTKIGYQLKLLFPIYIKCFIPYLITWYFLDKKVEA